MHPQLPLPRTTRRGFLQLAAASASFGALAGLRALPAVAAEPAALGTFFDARQTGILAQIAERMIDTGDPAMPRLRDTGAIAAIDRTCRALDPALTGLLPVALLLFEWGPIVLDWRIRRFTQLSDAEKDAYLAGWMNSRFEVRRMAFFALRNLSFLGYYSQDATWPGIGYAGPLLAAPGAFS
jgi:hypothetical protein